MPSYARQTSSQPKTKAVKYNTTGPTEAITQLAFLSPKIKTSRQIHDNIYERLGQNISLIQAKRIEELNIIPAGEYLYLFECMDYPDLYKIGRTGLTVSTRKNSVENKCSIQLREVARFGPIVTSLRAEQFVHDALKNYQRKFDCPKCRNASTGKAVQHREYFKVPVQLAKIWAEMSTTWFKKMPYLCTRSLDGEWTSRLRGFKDLPQNEWEGDDMVRLERWSDFARYSIPTDVKDELLEVLGLAGDPGETTGLKDVKDEEAHSRSEQRHLVKTSLLPNKVNTEKIHGDFEDLKQPVSLAKDEVGSTYLGSSVGADNIRRSLRQARKNGSTITVTFTVRMSGRRRSYRVRMGVSV